MCVCANKILLEHSHIHSLMWCIWLFSCYNVRAEYLWSIPNGHKNKNNFFIVVQVVFCLSPTPLPTTPPHHFLPISTSPCYCPCVLYNCSCKLFTLSFYSYSMGASSYYVRGIQWCSAQAICPERAFLQRDCIPNPRLVATLAWIPQCTHCTPSLMSHCRRARSWHPSSPCGPASSQQY